MLLRQAAWQDPATPRRGSIARPGRVQHRVPTPFQPGPPDADAVHMRRVPLLWQLLAINAVLIGGTVVAALLTSHPDLGTASGRQPIVVLGGGVVAVLL